MSPTAAIAASAGLATVAFGLLGCGSQEGFPPAAEPAQSPAPATDPAGKVVEVGPGEAEGAVADPVTGLVALGQIDPDAINLIDGSSGELVKRVEVPESVRHLQLVAPGGPVIGGAERTDELVEVTLPSGRVRTTEAGEYPHDATAAAGRIFVGDEGGDTVSVVEDGRLIDTLDAPEQPGGIAATDDAVAVVAVAERVIRLYDARTLEEIGEVDGGVGPTHVVAAADGRLYVADTEGDALLVYETEPEFRLTDRVNLPGSPYGIAIDERQQRLYVTRTALNEVTELELTDLTPKVLTSWPTVQQPNSVAVDSRTGRVFVLGQTRDELQLIDPGDEGAGG